MPSVTFANPKQCLAYKLLFLLKEKKYNFILSVLNTSIRMKNKPFNNMGHIDFVGRCKLPKWFSLPDAALNPLPISTRD
jgi:hypothetical protein